MIRRCFFLCFFVVFVGLFGTMMLGCSSDSSGSGSSTTTVTPTSIRVSATPNSINLGQTATIKAVVYDASGNTVSGINLTFKIDNPQVASVTSSATTGADGSATVAFKARDIAGSVIVTASSGTVSSTPPVTISIMSTTAPTDMNLTVNPTAILVQGTASVRAELLDSAGHAVPDGTSVSFNTDNELYGTFTSSTANTNGGIASATFKAAAQPGTASMTVRSGNLSEQINISILPAPAAGIQFSSANPQRIALRGSGGVETSIVQFIVKNSNNDPVEGATVSFSMTGPSGGEYIDPPPDPTPTRIDVSTNAQGIAQVILHSGTVAGPVNIVGTTLVANGAGGQIPISAQSSVISIGGGLPSAKRFGVSATKLNIPGLNFQNVETNITAYLADRFGNYNILKGTTVSFASEAGLAINTSSVTLDETGVASVKARSQIPALSSGPENVIPLSWENDLRSYIASTYGLQINHPRDGRCSVLVYVRGEEAFNDTNANGVYDIGETFIDTEDDPFIDNDDNGLYDGAGSIDPEELFIDAAGNGHWDGMNGRWDAEKLIFTNFRILLTGPPAVRWSLASQNFNVPQGGSASLKLLVCDVNGNRLPAGTTLAVTTDNGLVLGSTLVTYGDSSYIGQSRDEQLGMIEFNYVIADSDSADTEPPKRTTVTATVTWTDGGGVSHTISSSAVGMVD